MAFVLFFAICFARLLAATAESLRCNINLGAEVPSPQSTAAPRHAECDDGCESCTFFLSDGNDFREGTIECLAEKTCDVIVDATVDSAMRDVTLNGQLASAVSVITNGSGVVAWFRADIYAPIDGGDFHFRSSAESALWETKFHATNSGEVQIVFTDIGNIPGLHSMDVFAATAKRLEIVLQTNAEYFYYPSNSRIECPIAGGLIEGKHTCIWKSDATANDETDYGVDIIAPLGIPLGVQLICENWDACSGLRVKCLNETETCQMQYSDDVWDCNGACAIPRMTSTSVTPIISTTSTTRASTKLTESSTSRQTTQETSDSSDSQSGGGVLRGTLLYAVVICLCVVLCCGAVVCCCAIAHVYLWQRRKVTNPQMNENGTENTLSDSPPLVSQMNGESESATDLLIRAQPEGVPHAGTRKPPTPQIEGRVQKTKGQQFSGFELADAVADDELDEEIMYIPMPQTRQ